MDQTRTSYDAGEHAALREAFERICDLPRDQRADAVEQFCRNHPSIKERLRALLAQDLGVDTVRSVFRFGDAAGFRPLSPGQVVGNARVTGVLAIRAHSEIYEAEHCVSNRRLVIKLLFDSGSLLLPDSAFEARVLAVMDHQAIVPVLEAGVFNSELSESVPYLIMPYIEGENLLAWARSGHVSISRMVKALAEIADAIGHAHLRGIVHRDLKPSNILIDQDGRPRILDFGIGQLHEESWAGPRAGTPGYLAPERTQTESPWADSRSDVYSLGVIALQLIAGQTCSCVTSDELTNVVAEFRKSHRIPGVSAQMRAVIKKALSPDPNDRYEYAGLLAQDLRCAIEHRPVSAMTASVRRSVYLGVRRHPRISMIIALFAVALSVAVSASIRQSIIATRAQRLSQLRFEQTHGFANWVINDLDLLVSGLPRSTEVREQIVGRSIAVLDELRSTAEHDRDLLIDIAESRITLARIMAHAYGPNLGQPESSYALLQDAERDLRPMYQSDGDDRVTLLLMQVLEGYFWQSRDPAVEWASLDEAVAIGQRTASDSSDIRIQTALVHILRSRSLIARDQREAAGEDVQAAIEVIGGIETTAIADPIMLHNLGYVNMYHGLFLMESDPLSGRAEIEESMRLFTIASSSSSSPLPINACKALFYLARSYENHAETPKALSCLDQAIDAARLRVDHDSRDHDAARMLEVCLVEWGRVVADSESSDLALVARANQRVDEAIELYQARSDQGRVSGADLGYLPEYQAVASRLQIRLQSAK